MGEVPYLPENGTCRPWNAEEEEERLEEEEEEGARPGERDAHRSGSAVKAEQRHDCCGLCHREEVV